MNAHSTITERNVRDFDWSSFYAEQSVSLETIRIGLKAVQTIDDSEGQFPILGEDSGLIDEKLETTGTVSSASTSTSKAENGSPQQPTKSILISSGGGKYSTSKSSSATSKNSNSSPKSSINDKESSTSKRSSTSRTNSTNTSKNEESQSTVRSSSLSNTSITEKKKGASANNALLHGKKQQTGSNTQRNSTNEISTSSNNQRTTSTMQRKVFRRSKSPRRSAIKSKEFKSISDDSSIEAISESELFSVHFNNWTLPRLEELNPNNTGEDYDEKSTQKQTSSLNDMSTATALSLIDEINENNTKDDETLAEINTIKFNIKDEKFSNKQLPEATETVEDRLWRVRVSLLNMMSFDTSSVKKDGDRMETCTTIPPAKLGQKQEREAKLTEWIRMIEKMNFISKKKEKQTDAIAETAPTKTSLSIKPAASKQSSTSPCLSSQSLSLDKSASEEITSLKIHGSEECACLAPLEAQTNSRVRSVENVKSDYLKAKYSNPLSFEAISSMTGKSSPETISQKSYLSERSIIRYDPEDDIRGCDDQELFQLMQKKDVFVDSPTEERNYKCNTRTKACRGVSSRKMENHNDVKAKVQIYRDYLDECKPTKSPDTLELSIENIRMKKEVENMTDSERTSVEINGGLRTSHVFLTVSDSESVREETAKSCKQKRRASDDFCNGQTELKKKHPIRGRLLKKTKQKYQKLVDRINMKSDKEEDKLLMERCPRYLYPDLEESAWGKASTENEKEDHTSERKSCKVS